MVRVEGWSGCVEVMDMEGIGMGVECHRRLVMDVPDLIQAGAIWSQVMSGDHAFFHRMRRIYYKQGAILSQSESDATGH